MDAFDLVALGFADVTPPATGRPTYHPALLLKLHVYGYLNRVPWSRRLEREAGRNVEAMWLSGRPAPDLETIADFRRGHGAARRPACARFVLVCRELSLLVSGRVAVDGSEFKAVVDRDRNFTRAKLERRRAQIKESVARDLAQLDTADRQEPSDVLDQVQRRRDADPGALRVRREKADHPLDTLKARTGATQALMKTLPRVSSETALHDLAYDKTRVLDIPGAQAMLTAMST